ncbi:MAG: hypothetical protein WDA07_04160 [Leucobacter sp.]
MTTADWLDSGLREGLRATGSILGVSVQVTDGDAWELSDAGLEIGLGWYAARGHGEQEALALAMLQLWEGPRAAVLTPERSRRLGALSRRSPELEPLSTAVSRLQAAADLLTAMPALRERLGAALLREVGAAPTALPRHLQWVHLVLVCGITGSSPLGDAYVDEVLVEWGEIGRLGRGELDPLRRVIATDLTRSTTQRLERALTLLEPAYRRLLARDLEGRGIATRGDGPVDNNSAEDLLGGGDAAEQGGNEASEASAEDAPGEGDAPTQAPEPSDDRARQGAGRQEAEGSDLFAAERAGFIGRILATPLDGHDGLQELLKELPTDARAEPGAGAGSPTGERPREASSAVETPLADYRQRAAQLAGEIERMRRVWDRVIADRVSLRSVAGRRALPAGEELAVNALARALAQVRAGIARPDAFRARELRSRRKRLPGSTDYVLLVDRSASMQGPIAEAAADAALIMLESLAGVGRDIAHVERAERTELDLDLRTCLIVFDAAPTLIKPLSRGLDDGARRSMHAAIRAPQGSTNDAAALRLAAHELGFDRPSPTDSHMSDLQSVDGVRRRRILLLVSDGGSNDPHAAAREIRRLRAAGVAVHGIGIGVDDLAHRYAPTGYRVDDPIRLPAALEAIVRDELP